MAAARKGGSPSRDRGTAESVPSRIISQMTGQFSPSEAHEPNSCNAFELSQLPARVIVRRLVIDFRAHPSNSRNRDLLSRVSVGANSPQIVPRFMR